MERGSECGGDEGKGGEECVEVEDGVDGGSEWRHGASPHRERYARREAARAAGSWSD